MLPSPATDGATADLSGYLRCRDPALLVRRVPPIPPVGFVQTHERAVERVGVSPAKLSHGRGRTTRRHYEYGCHGISFLVGLDCPHPEGHVQGVPSIDRSPRCPEARNQVFRAYARRGAHESAKTTESGCCLCADEVPCVCSCVGVLALAEGRSIYAGPRSSNRPLSCTRGVLTVRPSIVACHPSSAAAARTEAPPAKQDRMRVTDLHPIDARAQVCYYCPRTEQVRARNSRGALPNIRSLRRAGTGLFPCWYGGLVW